MPKRGIGKVPLTSGPVPFSPSQLRSYARGVEVYFGWGDLAKDAGMGTCSVGMTCSMSADAKSC